MSSESNSYYEKSHEEILEMVKRIRDTSAVDPNLREDWDTLSGVCLENYEQWQNQLASLQSQVDSLTEQNLQLRLIADRAVVFLLAGSVPDPSLMSESQLHDLNEYMNSVKYDDLSESESVEHGFHSMLVEPLLNINNGDPDRVNLLELAMAEQNRRKLVDEEMGQLREVAKVKPKAISVQMRVASALNALLFARMAGVISEQSLHAQYSPAVIIVREE